MDLSIVVAAYNIAEFVEDCITSIVQQETRATFEVIAVDDGSTDETGDILKGLAESHPNKMVVVAQANGGLSAARNTGFAKSSGKYIWFVDGDDMIVPGAIESIVTTLKQRALDCVHFGFREVDEAGERLPGKHIPLQTGPCSGKAFFHEGVQCFHIATTAWTYVYRRALLAQSGLRFEPNLLHEDMLHTPLLLREAEYFMPLMEAPYLYRQRAGSITQDINPAKSKARIDCLIGIFQRLNNVRQSTADPSFRRALGWYSYHVYRKATNEARAANLEQSLDQLGRLNRVNRAWKLFPDHDWRGRMKKFALGAFYVPSTLFQRSYRDET